MKKLLLLVLLCISFGSGCGNINRIQQTAEPQEISQFGSLEVIPTSQWRHYARRNGINIRTGESRNPVTVLGHYPEYVELTEKLDAKCMQIPMNQWDAMTPEEQWLTTTGFFDHMIKSGHNFRLATPVGQTRPGSFYERELTYLIGKGYKLSPDGLWLVNSGRNHKTNKLD